MSSLWIQAIGAVSLLTDRNPVIGLQDTLGVGRFTIYQDAMAVKKPLAAPC